MAAPIRILLSRCRASRFVLGGTVHFNPVCRTRAPGTPGPHQQPGSFQAPFPGTDTAPRSSPWQKPQPSQARRPPRPPRKRRRPLRSAGPPRRRSSPSRPPPRARSRPASPAPGASPLRQRHPRRPRSALRRRLRGPRRRRLPCKLRRRLRPRRPSNLPPRARCRRFSRTARAAVHPVPGVLRLFRLGPRRLSPLPPRTPAIKQTLAGDTTSSIVRVRATRRSPNP